MNTEQDVCTLCGQAGHVVASCPRWFYFLGGESLSVWTACCCLYGGAAIGFVLGILSAGCER